MKKFILLLAFITVATALYQLPDLIKEWNYRYDALGIYIDPQGKIHKESQNEAKWMVFVAGILTSVFLFNIAKWKKKTT